MSYYVFTWNETDRTLKIACLCSEIFSVCACVSVMICGFSGAQASRRVTFLDNKCCLLSALTGTEVKGRGHCSRSSLLILFYVRQQPFEEPQCTFVCVSVCGCVLGLLWLVTDPGFYPARLTVRFHMSSGFYCSRRAGQESVGNKCKKALWRKEAIF